MASAKRLLTFISMNLLNAFVSKLFLIDIAHILDHAQNTGIFNNEKSCHVKIVVKECYEKKFFEKTTYKL